METRVLNFVQANKVGVLLLQAPTGSGKTTGIFRLVKAFPNLFGRTWMVQPTKVANASLGGGGMTPSQVLERVLRTKQFFCDTLVIDEVHTRSVEYETLLHLASLKRISIRIILLTATPCLDRMRTFFPELRHIHLQEKTTPFPIEIEYNPCFDFGFPSIYNIMQEVEVMLRANPEHKKVLVFLYTHEQCERLTTHFANRSTLHKTKALYGGMDQEEWDSFSHFIKTTEHFYIFATNVAETSVTIPGLSLIIDLGIQCINEKNRIVYTHCPKSSLIQRAGRTGRTCKGKVIRTMTEADFEIRPNERDPEFSWDVIFLRMLVHKCPRHFFPRGMDVEACSQRAKSLGIVSHKDQIDTDLIRFVIESPLLVQHSTLVYNVIGQKRYFRDTFIFVLVVAFIDAYISRNLRLLFAVPNINPNRQRMLWQNMFAPNQSDELHMMLNVFASCVLSSDPKAFAKRCFLNFKSIRIISNHVYRVFQFVCDKMRSQPIHWKLVLGSECSAKMSNNLFVNYIPQEQRRRSEQVFCFEPIDLIQSMLYNQKGLLTLFAHNDFLYNPKLYLNTHTCCIDPTENGNIPLLVFGQDPIALDQPNEVFLHVHLYTQCPPGIKRFHSTLSSSIIHKVYLFNDIRLCRKEHRLQMTGVFQYLLNSVAFRPGNWGIEKETDLLYQRILDFFRH